MKKEITIGYQNRYNIRGDLPTVPKIMLANSHLKELSGLSIGDKVTVEYLPDSIIIKKINHYENRTEKTC